MTTILAAVAAGLIVWVIRLRRRRADLVRQYEEQRHEYEIESAWANEYSRQATAAKAELGQLRRECAVLNWLHEGTTAMEQSAAWLAGLKIKK